MTRVATANATTADHALTEVIPAHLAERDLLPAEHLVETGAVGSDHQGTSTGRQIDGPGPIRQASSWQTRAAAGFGVACVSMDWPQSTRPRVPTRNTCGVPVITLRLAHRDCAACPQRAHGVSFPRSPVLVSRDRAADEGCSTDTPALESGSMQARQYQVSWL